MSMPAQVSHNNVNKCVVALPLLLCVSLALAQGTPQSTPQATPTTKKQADKFMSLEVVVNGVNSGTWPILDKAGVLYAPKMAFAEWRLATEPKAVAITARGQTYMPLASVPGFQWNINFSTQTLDVQFAPSAFSATSLLDQDVKRAASSPAMLGAFVNYDVNATHARSGNLPSSTDVGAVLELGITSAAGVLTHSYAAKNIFNAENGTTDRAWRRLETTYTYDLPQYNQTLRLGDTITSRGLWGREVYYAGLQWGSNHSLSPGINTRALPVVSGISSSPSTVELYVNDALRQVAKVPTGPFTIDNFPMVTGAGETRLVVKDVLGRETVLIQPFLTHQNLLLPGLNEWGVDLGLPRYNFGVENADYGKLMSSGFWRHGWNTKFSSETRYEITKQLRVLGFGGTMALPGQHVASMALVASQDKTVGNGHQTVLDITRVSDEWTYSLRALKSSTHFQSLGQTTSIDKQISLAGNVRVGPTGNLGVAISATDAPDKTRQWAASLTHSQKIGEQSSLVTTLTKIQGGQDTKTPNTSASSSGYAIGFSLNIPLDGGKNFSSSATAKSGASSGYVSATESMRGEVGSSWRVLAGSRETERYAEAGYSMQNNYGLLTADLQASAQQSVLRLGAQGSLIAAGGHVFARPKSVQSYALAEVKGYADVGVTVNGRPLGTTDASGVSLVAGLAAYQSNSVRLNAQDLPISAELDSIEVSVNPPWRSIVKANFPVRSGRAALLRIVLEDGQPAPVAAVVQIKGDAQTFYVARRGESYVTGLEPSNQLTMTWKEQSCTYDVALPPSTRDEILKLNPVVCKGVQR